MNWRTGIVFQAQTRIFLFSTTSIPALELIQSFLGLKQSKHEASSLSFNAEAYKLELKNRDNFTISFAIRSLFLVRKKVLGDHNIKLKNFFKEKIE
jgi:hypothetical protein